MNRIAQPAAPQQAQPPTIDFPHKPIALTLISPTNLETSSTPSTSAVESAAIANVVALAKVLAAHPQYAIPPPPNVILPKLSVQVTKAKTDGNALYAKKNYLHALRLYNLGIDLALSRPSWEATLSAREELAVLLSNRSVTYLNMDQPLNALADAETILRIKRFWPRGFFRKSRALLALGRPEEALQPLRIGLEYDKTDKELLDELKSQEAAFEKTLVEREKNDAIIQVQ